MNFASLPYIVLLTLTVILFYNLSHWGRVWLLIVASVVFYAFWNIPLVSLLIISSLMDYTMGLLIFYSEDQKRRRIYLCMSLSLSLGLLGYFKYCNFFLENLAFFGLEGGAYHLDILLPPGISFYTFQTMSYTIDVYRRQITPTKSLPRFFLYVAFFPQLVAGPIMRAADLLPQFDHLGTRRFSMDNFVIGSRMIIFGLFKKVMIADYCGMIADQVYASPAGYTGWSALVATYAFSLQIYCDFSAYSEIARGSARLFGIDVMQNFDQPYLTTNIIHFWRRWHISLSTWIRDYLYIPLGGSQLGRLRTLINLVITMFLSGLWHGAAWTFVCWGLYHGLLLLLTTLGLHVPAVQGFRKRLPGLAAASGWFLTLNLVALGWILFRAQSLRDAAAVLGEIVLSLVHLEAMTLAQAGFFAFAGAFLLLSFWVRYRGLMRRIDESTLNSVLFYGALVVVMLLLHPGEGRPFIYFQF
ncbi:MAG: MBOAT family protein [Candidatus Hydrogenedentes bacterium]|nr:MBOAT family protein [Candidatus Hydrogenedentota bacterium]